MNFNSDMLHWVLCILTTYLSVISYSQSAGQNNKKSRLPLFKDRHPRNVSVYLGERAKLSCHIERLGTRSVIWRRSSDDHPLTIGLFTFVGDTRIKAKANKRTNEWSLIIEDTRLSDDDIYECQVSTTPKIGRNVRLNVRENYKDGAQVITIATSNEYVVIGGPVFIECNATGRHNYATGAPEPPPAITWYKDGDPIDSNAETGVLITKKNDMKTNKLISTLSIRKSKKQDTGTYICRSDTEKKDTDSVTIYVINEANDNVKRSGTSVQHVRSASQKTASAAKNAKYISLVILSLTMSMVYRTHLLNWW
ncbi:unnamed protein product [Owenia fusiformis]|uniref:Uncharacterized protein n=1 Tax=Owenia fusiformis TaxID=6347 RepID=A0A8J1TTY6_OWEFU|nr:unnamed protein product [Owenia fusiformis]